MRLRLRTGCGPLAAHFRSGEVRNLFIVLLTIGRCTAGPLWSASRPLIVIEKTGGHRWHAP